MADPHLLGFLIIVAFIAVATVRAIEAVPSPIRAGGSLLSRRPRMVIGGWVVLSALPTQAGLMAPDGPIPPQVMMVLILTLAVAFGVSSTGTALVEAIPLYVLVGFQGFRLPLEIVLHAWVEQGVAPPQMTWTGSNIDIVAGVVALLAIPVVRARPRTAWLPTLIGVALLGNVVRIVGQSLPGPLQAFPDPITLPTRFPHVWIATICVAAAVTAHILALRALVRLRARDTE